MTDYNNDFLIDVPVQLNSEEDLNEILEHIVKIGGSDLYILGDDYLYAHYKQRKIPISRRKIGNKEAYSLGRCIAGDAAESHLGSGKALSPSYDYRIETVIDGAKRKVRRRFRTHLVPCLRGGQRSITITIRPIASDPPSATDDLNIEPEIIDVAMKSKQGMMLMVGATGTGKSTTLAGCIKDRMEKDPFGVNLVTAEEPIEFVYDRVKGNTPATQMEIGIHLETFDIALREMMRMHPDIILVGEIRDFETMKNALAASVSGHFLFSTLHTNSVAETLQRMIGLYPTEIQHQARLDILQAISVICAQKLVPTTDGGITALREYLVFTQEIKNKLIKSTSFVEDVIKFTEQNGISMEKAAKNAFANEIIDQYTYEQLTMRS